MFLAGGVLFLGLTPSSSLSHAHTHSFAHSLTHLNTRAHPHARHAVATNSFTSSVYNTLTPTRSIWLRTLLSSFHLLTLTHLNAQTHTHAHIDTHSNTLRPSKLHTHLSFQTLGSCQISRIKDKARILLASSEALWSQSRTLSKRFSNPTIQDTAHK